MIFTGFPDFFRRVFDALLETFFSLTKKMQKKVVHLLPTESIIFTFSLALFRLLPFDGGEPEFADVSSHYHVDFDARARAAFRTWISPQPALKAFCDIEIQ